MRKLDFSFLKKNTKYLLLVLVLGVLSGLSYYMSQYQNRLDTLKEQQTVSSSQNVISSDSVWQKYSDKTEFPNFVYVTYRQSPDNLTLEHDYQESYGVEVISTGNFSETVIKDSKDSEIIARVLQVEVVINDGSNYLDRNEKFNLAVHILPREDTGVVISPSWTLQILGDIEISRLVDEVSKGGTKDLTEEDSDYIYEKGLEFIKEISESTLTEEKIKETFSANRELVIIPYIKNEALNYYLKGSEAGDYLYFIDRYYEGEDSLLVDKILMKDTSGLKEPLLPLDIKYLGKYD